MGVRAWVPTMFLAGLHQLLSMRGIGASVNADIDISLQVGPVTNPSLIARRIATTRWLLCAAPSYLQVSGTPMVPADLLNHNCLNFLPQTYRSVWPLRDESKDAPDDKSPSRYEALGNVASNSDNFLRVTLGISRHYLYELAAWRTVSA
jgi:DNA-binding transcriptional LysR family regulator